MMRPAGPHTVLHRRRSSFAILAVLGAAAAVAAHPDRPDAPLAPVPADLLLSPEQVVEARALSHFAWGLFLDLQHEARWLEKPSRTPRVKPAAPPAPDTAPPVPQLVPPTVLAAPRPAPSGPALPAPIVRPLPEPAAPLPASPFPEHVQHYLAALRLAPDSPEVLAAIIGSIGFGLDLEALGDDLAALADAHPGAANLALVVSEIEEARERPAAATARLERCLEAGDWHDARVVRKLATRYWSEERHAEVNRLLRRALRTRQLRDDFGLRVSLAAFHLEAAERPEARADERQRRRLRDDAAAAARDAAATLRRLPWPLEQGQDDALALVRILHDLERYQEALDLTADVRNAFAAIDGELEVWEAEALLKLNRSDEAAVRLADMARRFAVLPPALEAAGGSRPARPPDRTELEARWEYRQNNINLGRLYVEMDKPREAAAAYERALRVAPSDPRLRLILGQLYLAIGQTDRAIELAEGIDDLLQFKYQLLSHAFHREGKSTEAARYLAMAEEAALKAGHQEFFTRDFYLYYATLCEEAGLIERAMEKAEQALALDPQDAVSANFLGYVLADYDRDLPRAEALIRLAVAAEPENEAYADSLAWVYYRQERYPEAWDWIQKALRFSGDKPDAVILDHAGDIAAALGKWDDARASWQQAIAAGIKNPDKVRAKLNAIPAGH